MSVETEKDQEEVAESPDIDFKPLVSLPLIETKTLEDNEDELLKLRAKLFRFEATSDPPEWKERGVGEVKLMKNRNTSNVRLIMRRDKTHKICANHILTKEMKLVPSIGSDRAWVWNVMADFADEEPKKEQLAIRFRNAEIAQKFKFEFEKCQQTLPILEEGSNDLADNLEKLNVNETEDTKTQSQTGATPAAEEETSKSSTDTQGNNTEPSKTENGEGSSPGSETSLHETSDQNSIQQDTN